MLISKLSGLLNSIPRAIDHTYSIFFTTLNIIFRYKFLAKGAQHNSFKLFLMILNRIQQFKSFHLLTCTFLAVTLLEINHKQRHLLLRLLYLLPFTFLFLLFFILLSLLFLLLMNFLLFLLYLYLLERLNDLLILF